MFRAIISPIFRSTRLFVTACGIMHPRCCRPAAWKRRNSSSRHYTSTAWPSLDGHAVLWPWEERHGQSMAFARHGKCESDTASLRKSIGQDTF